MNWLKKHLITFCKNNETPTKRIVMALSMFFYIMFMYAFRHDFIIVFPGGILFFTFLKYVEKWYDSKIKNI